MLPTIIGIIAIIFVVGMFVRGHIIQWGCSHSKEVRNAEPFHYKSHKQGTINAKECNELAKKKLDI